MNTVTAPQCMTPGCERGASQDSEEGGHFSTCDRCGVSFVSGAGLHAHRHSFSPAQEAAHGGPHSWVTATTLRPVVEDDEIVRWACREDLPGGRGACGYETSRADMDAYLAYRRGEAFLCSAVHAASSGHGTGPQADGHEMWVAFEAMRNAWTAAHPTDVR
ncbi:hypothetical protein AB0H73_10090 [Streptomyces olivoreticuli]